MTYSEFNAAVAAACRENAVVPGCSKHCRMQSHCKWLLQRRSRSFESCGSSSARCAVKIIPHSTLGRKPSDPKWVMRPTSAEDDNLVMENCIKHLKHEA